MPIFMFGQSYSDLWKEAEAAERKDLPKTAYEKVQKIIGKATKEKAYGQLLKAELKGAQLMAIVAPDSLKPAVERIRQQSDATENEVLKTVYQTVLYRLCQDNWPLEVIVEKPVLTETLCRKLAAVQDKSYQPLVIKGADAGIFGHDLLHVVGFELRAYKAMYDYYVKSGNRRAASILAAQVYEYASREKLDSLMEVYGDLPEAGELAITCYQNQSFGPEDGLDFIHESLRRWGSWQRMDILRNAENELTNPQFHVDYDRQRVQPMQAQTIRLSQLRNLSSLTMTVYQLDVDGDFDESPSYQKGYEKIKKHIVGVASQQVKSFSGKRPFDVFEDTLTLEGLPTGVYMVEFSAKPSMDVLRHLYHVTDVYTIAESQPLGQGVRYVVVSATTGQPIAGAHLRITEHIGYMEVKTTEGVTDKNGEYILNTKDNRRHREAFAYTENDRACPVLSGSGRYDYYDNDQVIYRTNLFTDRAIYRPGQRVQVAALLYQVQNGIEQSVREKKTVNFVVRDANGKVMTEKTELTDEYGVCAMDFTLPASGLTGVFSIEANDARQTIRVEEYKRPTFHVDFPEVKQAYAAGDTLTVQGRALSYAGVPVQEARVSYKVMRRTAFWWWSYSRYWDTAIQGYGNNGGVVFIGEAVTGQDGSFDVQMPLQMPETSYPMFYNFVVIADVTDAAGETHSGQLSLPLGNRKQALSIDLKEKVLLEDQPKATFHLLNAAGKDLDAEVRYQVDSGPWQTAKTNSQLSIADIRLSSGKHVLEAVCEGDTVRKEFVLFSLDDQHPSAETDDWFYLSDTSFPGDGSPVVIQVGSSDQDVHIVYSIFSGETVLERGAVDKSNTLINRKLTYKKEYGEGLLLTFAWVKNGRCYTHTATIQRPLPDKKLRLQWTTFRDRLTPGQQEEWTLSVRDADGNPVECQLMAALYDQSLDQLTPHQWNFSPYQWLSLPNTQWNYPSIYKMSGGGAMALKNISVKKLLYSTFDTSVFPSAYYRSFRRFSRGAVLEAGEMKVMASAAPMTAAMMKNVMVEPEPPAFQEMAYTSDAVEAERDESVEPRTERVQVRENLNETAFFYPQLVADEQGVVALKFTLPESLTTWRFLGLAHTRDLYYGTIEGETVAQKDVMIQPNVPRFLRVGDAGMISARLFNTGEKALKGTATLRLIDPETNIVVAEQKQTVELEAGSTASVSFRFVPDELYSMLICQMTVSGAGFSDGEQHYLPILPSMEHVTVTVPITQHQPGVETINLASLIPADGKDGKLTVEYTNNPAWLMVQALPSVGKPVDDNAVSQAASYYANSLGKYLIDHQPEAKKAFDLWKSEQGDETSLMSALEKNQELKDLVLNETPWVLDAESETEQKQRLADFFDENLMAQRLSSSLNKLRKLQLDNGAWTWWPEMPGSFYMTVAVSEMLVRLNAMTGTQKDTQRMLDEAFVFMGMEIVDEVKEMKKWAKKGHEPSFPSFKALEWLYLVTLDGRELSGVVEEANAYLLKLLKKDIKRQSIYEKALTSVILSKSDPALAAEYVQSLKEYTVYREEMGRYYDTPRAGYSWYDYKIPTQTMAIEALQRLTPDDRKTIGEMQRWLLQEKRTQAWDTPINSVNAVYAFLQGGDVLKIRQGEQSVIKTDGQTVDTSEATAALGYVRTSVPATSSTLTIEKTAEGTSWGAVYAQFLQPVGTIDDHASGLTVKRELIPLSQSLSVGDRVKVRITITADRDYDFVQVVDRRAACMEPVRQLSGYHNGSYCTPKDHATNYYFDCLSKGKHVIENEYYIDRAGTYTTGTCTVQCAYSPEFCATTGAIVLDIQ